MPFTPSCTISLRPPTRSSCLPAHRWIEEEDIECISPGPGRWTRFQAIGKNLLDRVPEEPVLDVLVEEVMGRADYQADSPGQPPIDISRPAEQAPVVQA